MAAKSDISAPDRRIPFKFGMSYCHVTLLRSRRCKSSHSRTKIKMAAETDISAPDRRIRFKFRIWYCHVTLSRSHRSKSSHWKKIQNGRQNWYLSTWSTDSHQIRYVILSCDLNAITKVKKFTFEKKFKMATRTGISAPNRRIRFKFGMWHCHVTLLRSHRSKTSHSNKNSKWPPKPELSISQQRIVDFPSN